MCKSAEWKIKEMSDEIAGLKDYIENMKRARQEDEISIDAWKFRAKVAEEIVKRVKEALDA